MTPSQVAAAAAAAARRRNDPRPLLTTHMVRKYIQYARMRYPTPTMTADAGNLIASKYTEMRASSDEKVLPVTARTLETMIRLSTAHARLRLSANVEALDVSRALAVLEYAIFARERHTAERRLKSLKRKRSDDKAEEATAAAATAEEAAAEEDAGAPGPQADADVAAADAAAGAAADAPPPTAGEAADSELAERVEFQNAVRRVLLAHFDKDEEACTLDQLAAAVPQACEDEGVPYRLGALITVLNAMHDDDKVFVDPSPLVAGAPGTVRQV